MDNLSLAARTVAPHFGDLEAERRALAEGTACVDLGDYVFVDVMGDDRLSYLQTKITQHTAHWTRDGGGYTTAVDIDGKLLFEAWAWVLDDRVRLVMPPGVADDAVAHLDRFVILEDVRFERPALTLSLLGARAAEGLPAPNAGWTPHGEGAVVRLEGIGPLTFGLVTAAGTSASEVAPEGVRVGAQAWAEATVRAGSALVGRDAFVGETIPIEAGLWRGISFRKGCYLGQEVIERLFSRGRPNKRLMQLSWEGAAVAPRTPLEAGGKSAGFVTASFAEGGLVHALGYVRRKHLDSDALTVEGATVSIGAYVGGEAPSDDG